jgi:signal transduction histidine kinase/DNA-binding response OmpR family regulator
MDFDDILGVVLDLAYFAIFGFTLRDYLRRRDSLRLAVVAVFASLAAILGASALRELIPGSAAAGGAVSTIAFLASPLLVLWLVYHFRPDLRRLLILGTAAFVVLAALSVALLALPAAPRSGPAGLAFLAGFVVYFTILEVAAALGFAAEATRRRGTSRVRLGIAALATAMLGAAVVVLVIGGIAGAAGADSSGVGVIVELVALVAALGFLAAFAPPQVLRRLTQQTIAFDFIRDLNLIPPDGSDHEVWALLASTAIHASGARSATVRAADGATVSALSDDGTEPPSRTLEVPFGSGVGSHGVLELGMTGSPLFVEDDIDLLRLLGDRAARAAERAAFLRERERLIADLQAASAAKSDFLAAMSHELRTPLNAIIGFSELLTDPSMGPAEPPTVVEYAGHIHDSGLHLLDLINEVLDLARVEAGRIDLKPVAFDLAAVLADIGSTMRPLADRKSIRLEVRTRGEIRLVADPNRIRQIAFNLLSNAIKFTQPHGSVTLTASSDGDEVMMSVDDSGRGIAAADLGRIFEAFERGRAPEGGVTEGTGLGLALTRRLVDAHGGRIGVTSELGVGSRFVVHLPARPDAVTRRAGLPPAIPGETSVLVIEDDPSAAELLRVYLEGAGYSTAVTASGEEGLRWARELRPSAIVLDILLPDTDGWDVLQRLKRADDTRSIPVLVVSVVDDRPLGLALGAVDYFVKPIGRESLLEALGRLTFTTKVKTRTVTALVIDPDQTAAARYRDLLEPEGFRVDTASDGARGRAQAAATHPDLILLDLLQPDVDGFDLVAQLKSDPATTAIPIWVTTPSDLAPADKERLNGEVLGIAERGDAAMEALRRWLNPVPAEAPS